MAGNFYEAGLEYLLEDVHSIFDNREKAVMRWLLETAKRSEATYWDAVTQLHPLSPMGVIIENIKSKCRAFNMHAKFEEMRDAVYKPEPVIDKPA